MMNEAEQFDMIAKEVRKIYRSDPNRAVHGIDNYLGDELRHLSAEERVLFFDRLLNAFPWANTALDKAAICDEPSFRKIFSLIIGKELTQNEELSTDEFLRKLSEPLNNIFDMLNDLVRVMNLTLTGSESGGRTIRTLIGSHVTDETPSESLEQYLSQIKDAFLTVHHAFKEAAEEKVGMILRELNPDRVESEAGGGLKIGPMKKAEAFERYRQKFERISKWFDSGRFAEDLAREFEKRCRNRLEKS